MAVLAPSQFWSHGSGYCGYSSIDGSIIEAREYATRDKTCDNSQRCGRRKEYCSTSFGKFIYTEEFGIVCVEGNGLIEFPTSQPFFTEI
mmetsp:Transcript_27827/g.55626  ORF Transcript_27827/g.55626 Transcript_27827/m.55626 type:complete len:89 (-) Transcript_27827:160-426(-)